MTVNNFMILTSDQLPVPLFLPPSPIHPFSSKSFYATTCNSISTIPAVPRRMRTFQPVYRCNNRRHTARQVRASADSDDLESISPGRLSIPLFVIRQLVHLRRLTENASSLFPSSTSIPELLQLVKQNGTPSDDEGLISKLPFTPPKKSDDSDRDDSDKDGPDSDGSDSDVSDSEKAPPDESPITVPTEPPFDPITAFILGGYAFRSYSNPPDGAHREVFKTTTVNRTSENPKEVITTCFYYPHAPAIAVAATGVFLLTFRTDIDENDDMPDELENVLLTMTLNATVIDIEKPFPSSSTILRLRDLPFNSTSPDDILSVHAYTSGKARENGQQATHVAKLSLRELVEEACEKGEQHSLEAKSLQFRKLEKNEREKDFFQTTILSSEVQLPFNISSNDAATIPDEAIQSLSLTLDVSYVPLDSDNLQKAMQECGRGDDEQDERQKEFFEDLCNAADTVSSFESVTKFESDDENSEEKSKPKNVGTRRDFSSKTDKDKAEAFRQAAESLNDLVLEKQSSDDEKSRDDEDDSQKQDESEKMVQAVSEELEKNVEKMSKEAEGVAPSLVKSALRRLSMPDPTKLFRQYLESSSRLPDVEDWIRLSSAARVMIQTADVLPFERATDLIEDATGCLFLECDATDTQVWFFVDEENKSVVTSFRGTEQVSIRDFVTDAQLFLQCWTPGDEIRLDITTGLTVGLPSFLPDGIGLKQAAKRQEDEMDDDRCAVHYGFLQAYKSIQDALHRALGLLSNDLDEEYSFYFTGHSLGGALATLAAVDMQKRYGLGGDRLCVMTFGAPKVGNVNFVRHFNETVPNAFRIVNDADAIARLPQSVGGDRPLYRYGHAGRTTLINENGEYWIEGVHDMDGNVIFDRTEEADAQTGSQVKEGWYDVDMDRRTEWSRGSEDLEKLLNFDHESTTELLSMCSVKQHMVSLMLTLIFLYGCWDPESGMCRVHV